MDAMNNDYGTFYDNPGDNCSLGPTVNYTSSDISGYEWTCSDGSATCDPSEMVLTAIGPDGEPASTTTTANWAPSLESYILSSLFQGLGSTPPPPLPVPEICGGVFGFVSGEIGKGVVKGEWMFFGQYDTGSGGSIGGLGAVGLGSLSAGGEVTIDLPIRRGGVHVAPIGIAGGESNHPIIGTKKIGVGAYGTPGSIGGYVNVGRVGAGAFVSACP